MNDSLKLHRVTVSLSLLLTGLTVAAQETPQLEKLSVEDLMKVRVVTASNTSERLFEAPATVIVITREEIRQRGYANLSQILDDLPGMDAVRPWGATYLKNYWRGYRNTIGDPYLIMIDGVVFNHLYFNTADVMVAFPLTNIDRVEIVYGPASSVYGASAFMGVVNVITRNDEPANGSFDTVMLGAGSDASRLVDASLLYKRGDLRFAFTTRFDNGLLDDHSTERYEYTRHRYYADHRLWGGFADDPNVGGSFSSPWRHRALEVRMFAGESVELAVQYFRVNAGYGVEYAGDRAQNHAVWSRPDLSAHIRLARPLGDRVRGTTLVRYRTSGVSSDSDFVESPLATATSPRLVRFSFWHVANSSITLLQDFDVRISDALALRTGVRYEQKDLQKAYDVNYGPLLPPPQIDAARYPYPQPPSGANQAQNRITTEDSGVYVQTWYRASERHRVNVGLREDHNSKYGSATTLRMGYVGTFGAWNLKTLFGQAFEEPNNRLLYGGWDGSGSDPRLRPERSSTFEVSASRTTQLSSALLSVYRIHNINTFVNTVHTALNLGDRKVFGFDVHAQALLARGEWEWKPWLYYSRIARADERKVDERGNDRGMGRIGDLARNRLVFGVTTMPDRHLTATLRGRYVGPRITVETNPVGRVPSYVTLDALIRYDDLFASGVGVSLSVTNLGNRAYFHPGVRDANAGAEPGALDSAGVWHGSGGFFNSLLPQPGRALLVSLHFER